MDRRARARHARRRPQPRTLGFLDQIALWGNLGVSLLGPTAALFVLADRKPMSLLAAFVAVVVGTLIGVLAVAALANGRAPQTGQPAMVLLRGLFGARLSYLPTVLNLVQVLGWAHLRAGGDRQRGRASCCRGTLGGAMSWPAAP